MLEPFGDDFQGVENLPWLTERKEATSKMLWELPEKNNFLEKSRKGEMVLVDFEATFTSTNTKALICL